MEAKLETILEVKVGFIYEAKIEVMHVVHKGVIMEAILEAIKDAII